MAKIQLTIQDKPLIFEKAILLFLGEIYEISPEQSFRKFDSKFVKAVENVCLKLIDHGIETLEQIGDIEDYLDLLYLSFENSTDSTAGRQALQVPFNLVEKRLETVLLAVADELAEKFYEELTNRLAETVDDEIDSSFFLDGLEMTVEIAAPVELRKTFSLTQLIRDYHSVLQEMWLTFYESLL